MMIMKNRARRCASIESVPPAAPAVLAHGAPELAPVPLGSPASCTFGPDNLSLDAYMASADFAPQSLEELQEELEQGC